MSLPPAGPHQGPPGWKANNDLWLLPATGRLRQSLPPPGAAGAYGWWGREIAVSPDGRMVAYGGADGVGLLDLETGEIRQLAAFAPWRTYGDWVWTPTPAWSPDGRNVAAVVHGRATGAVAAEDSPVFDLWMLPVDGASGKLLAANVGMWALPAWSPTGEYVAYGVAQEPASSANSRYDLRRAAAARRAGPGAPPRDGLGRRGRAAGGLVTRQPPTGGGAPGRPLRVWSWPAAGPAP